MGLYTELPSQITEVDVIIAGGGTAACVVAARLAAASPSLSILVIESGPNNYDEPTVVHPGLFASHMIPSDRMNTIHMGKMSDSLGGRPFPVISGRVLGGGSSINTSMYARGQKSDYDDWGVPGWTADELMPYFNRFENYDGDGEPAHHGSNGPIQVTRGSFQCPKMTDDLLNVMAKKTWLESKDIHSMQPDAINAGQRALRYISRDGRRQDSAHCYLHPLLQDGQHANLHVLVESEVVRVLVEGAKATGVEYQPNHEFNPDGETERRQVRARKLVVVSGGAFGSPAILERSGIGSQETLQRANVPLKVHLPGVGVGYEDHQMINYPYMTSLDPHDTMNPVVFGSPEELMRSRAAELGSNAQEMSIKMRPTDDEVAALGPEFQHAWDSFFAAKPDKPLILLALFSCFPGIDPSIPFGSYIGLSIFSAYPLSRGHVHITGPSPSDALDFDAGFFADKDHIDLKKHVWAYKKQRELARRMQCYRGEVASWHPPFPRDSDAACIVTAEPLPDHVADIRYTADDDGLIETFLRERIGTVWHSMGTCKMAAREKMGVVDGSLGVYGVAGLKVADLSIVPANIAANPASTALAIGEKAADIIIGELGLAA